jgi:hypothetical protein
MVACPRFSITGLRDEIRGRHVLCPDSNPIENLPLIRRELGLEEDGDFS